MSDRFRVWAPGAHTVDVLVGDLRIAAHRDETGIWYGPRLGHGQRYAISVDGGRPLPDPRSRYQPDGVDGMSCHVDLEPVVSSFRQPTLRDAVIYELHVGTFDRAGTFEGGIPHLDALAQLGITHVELMPIAQFSGVHGWGYDGVDLFAPHAPYGGPRGLRALIAACHARGLGVIIDVVHNHFGPEGAPWNQLGPYTTPRHKTPWGDAINLDGDGSDEVRRFLIDSALAWLRDYGADGLRLDAVHALVDTSERHFIAQLVDEVRALERTLGRSLVLIGEYDDHDPKAVTERERGGWGLDAHWNDDFHHAVHVMLTGEHGGYYSKFAAAGTLDKVLENGYTLGQFGPLPRDRLVAYVQSHDQVGNRALGERLHQIAGLDRARLAAALLFTSPFVPMLFQGEEWAASTPFLYVADHASPELREAVRKGRAAEHAGAGAGGEPPDPIDPATRDRSVLRWDEREHGDHAAMLAWYGDLIEVRRTYPALRDPRPASTRVHRDGDLLVVERSELQLVCNLGDRPARTELGDVLLASKALPSATELPPLSCALVRRPPDQTSRR